MANPIILFWKWITRNWKVPFDPRQANLGYTTSDGTFYPGYMTRGGEVRYEKKGIPPTFGPVEYLESSRGVRYGCVSTGLFSAQVIKQDCQLDIFRQKNNGNGKYRYWEGSSQHINSYIDAAAYVKSKVYIPVDRANYA